MLKQALNIVFYVVLFASLLLYDYVLGNGFMSMIQRRLCKFVCFVKRTLRNHSMISQDTSDTSIFLLTLEIGALCCTMLLLNKYKKFSIDKLMDDKKGTNDFMKKMKIQRISGTTDFEQTSNSNIARLIKPVKLAVPILHMAIVDSVGSVRSQPERGDAGDVYNAADSAILSMTAVFNSDSKIREVMSDDSIELDESNNVQYNNCNRYLWDVIEEE